MYQHTDVQFAFEVAAPFAEVVPLFGADRERDWAPGWSPRFVHPQPAADVPGMVFTLAHDDGDAIWVNTAFDLQAGAIEYVYVRPNLLTTTVTLVVSARGDATHVRVRYQRTALTPAGETLVAQLAAGDRDAGPEWAQQIAAALVPRSLR